MRIRWTGIPLPGPFRITAGRGRRGSGSGGVWLLAAVALGFAIEYPWLIAAAAGLVLAAWLVSRYATGGGKP